MAGIKIAHMGRPRGSTTPGPGALARLLASTLEERGIAQLELAQASGASQTQISSIITGETQRPWLSTLRRLEDGLARIRPDLPRVDLVGVLDPRGQPIGLSEFLASPWAHDITDAERAHLQAAHWVPSGSRATARDWRLFLDLVRSLPRDPPPDREP